MKAIITLMIMLVLLSCRKTDDLTSIQPIRMTTNAVATDSVFNGYKVNATDNNYWLKGTPIMSDFFVSVFQPTILGQDHNVRATSCAMADFNKDGYLDIFNAGFLFTGSNGVKQIVGFSFLQWNVTKKIFEPLNLFNDTSFQYFGANINKVIPIDLNKDGYMDFVVFDNGDEGIKNSKDEPIRIVLSDGKGKYDLKEIETSETETYKDTNGNTRLIGWHKEGGDIADLNGDGVADLVITCNVVTYIYWGITQYPYFTKTNRAMMLADNNSYGNIGNNGFGENCSHCANYAFNATIADMNNDGNNDIILSSAERSDNNLFVTHERILFNKGKGRFNDSSVMELQDYKIPNSQTQDYVIDDLNNDGRKDMIGLSSLGTDTWDIFAYIQQADGTFKTDYSYFNFTTTNRTKWKPRLLYADFNNDGKKDVSYIDCDLGLKPATDKTIFIRNGSQFNEVSYFQIDSYAKSLLK